MTQSDPRFLRLATWLTQRLNDSISITLISGDASFRRYFRVTDNDAHFIAVDSPPQLVPIAPFIALDKALADVGLLVPAVLAQDEALGFMLLEDLGDCQLGMCLRGANVRQWYTQALDLLPQMAAVQQTDSGPLPVYNNEFIARELAIFPEWLLGVHLGWRDAQLPQQLLSDVNHCLSVSALAQPVCGMHRDFHSRNIMVRDDQLYLIDFQDAVSGPLTYDAVSLLRDCYVRWDDELVMSLARYHMQLMQDKGFLDADVSWEAYQRWFDLMGLQRHIKVAGIFARLYHRDGKAGYLKDIPLTLEYIRDIARKYPELSAFGHWVEAELIPAFAAREAR